ncbi:MAG TPA: HIT family protein [Caulobacteraceae bacterium]|nr:HIT family protein [Caulobacteraceae bacterium]
MAELTPFDLEGYTRRTQGRCFICRMLAGDPEYRHHVVYEDDAAIAFLNKYPTLAGHTLVCPKAHLEQVTGDFTEAEYLALQAVVRRVAEAVRQAMGAARVYVLSFGSNEANSHVHWHVAPLPPGVPLEEQQFVALDASRGVLALNNGEMAEIAASIRDALTPHP